jgi:hypothetical protein
MSTSSRVIFPCVPSSLHLSLRSGRVYYWLIQVIKYLKVYIYLYPKSGIQGDLLLFMLLAQVSHGHWVTATQWPTEQAPDSWSLRQVSKWQRQRCTLIFLQSLRKPIISFWLSKCPGIVRSHIMSMPCPQSTMLSSQNAAQWHWPPDDVRSVLILCFTHSIKQVSLKSFPPPNQNQRPRNSVTIVNTNWSRCCGIEPPASISLTRDYLCVFALFSSSSTSRLTYFDSKPTEAKMHSDISSIPQKAYNKLLVVWS